MPEIDAKEGLAAAASHVYDGRQVDEYVTKLLEHIDLLDREIESLREHTCVQGGGHADDESAASERVLGRALLVAQQVAERLAAEARQEGAALVAAAGRQRDEILTQARDEAAVVIADGQREADRLVKDAKARIASIPAAARSEALEIIAAAEEKADRIVADARHQADEATRAWDAYFEAKIAGIEGRLFDRVSEGRGQTPPPGAPIDDAVIDVRARRDPITLLRVPDAGPAPGRVPWPATMGAPGIDRLNGAEGETATEPPLRPTWLGVDVARMPSTPLVTPSGATIDQMPPPPTGRPVIPVDQDPRAGTSPSPLGRLFRR